MTAYATPSGAEILVCDRCGIDNSGGTRPDVSTLMQIDHEEGLRRSLREDGPQKRTEHYCPPCGETVPGAVLMQEPAEAPIAEAWP